MRLNRLLTGLLTLAIGTVLLSSCLNEENKIPPNCFDGIQNNNEEGVDCGGPCEQCPPTCFNGVWDVYPEDFGGWVEEDVDCGCPCEPCPTCDDGIMNQGETGIDCGGIDEDGDPICDPCPDEAGDCTNGIMDGDEIGIDCGGSSCPDCPDTVVDCTDGIINGDEEYFDCGGCCCPDCPEPMVSFFIPSENGVLDLYYGTVQFDMDFNIVNANAIGLPAGNPILSWDIDRPLTGWNAGAQFIFDEDTAPDNIMTFVVDGETYTSDDEDAPGVTLVINEIDQLSNPPGTTISGTFSGALNLQGADDEDFEMLNGTFTLVVIP
jgi:hypothetical protein